MRIVFDLDYTLLDTVKFKEALVAATGVDEKKYNAVYSDTVAGNNGLFDPDKLFEELRGRELLRDDAAAAEARRRFNDVLGTTEQYLYDDAKELLLALGKHREAAVELMTFGNAKWQMEKVENSGLRELFRDVLYTEKDKKEVVRRLGEGEDKVIIVNDNGKEMEEMMSVAPEYAYILKKGPKPVPNDLRLPTAETIEALAALLERETGWELRREMREAKEGKEGNVGAPDENVRGEIDTGERNWEREPPPEHQPGARM